MGRREQVQRWIARRAQDDDRLYEQYAKGLEPEHQGEFVAISDDGRLIRGPDELAVATQAREQFGLGAFALRRIGAEAEIRWRRLPL